MKDAFGIVSHPVIAVALGSAAGGVFRYYIGKWVGPSHFPWATFGINVAGSFLLALSAIVVLERMPAQYHAMYLLVGVGFCGGFTTFSTFEWELFKLVRNGFFFDATAYAVGSVVAGLAGVFAAVWLAATFSK